MRGLVEEKERKRRPWRRDARERRGAERGKRVRDGETWTSNVTRPAFFGVGGEMARRQSKQTQNIGLLRADYFR